MKKVLILIKRILLTFLITLAFLVIAGDGELTIEFILLKILGITFLAFVAWCNR